MEPVRLNSCLAFHGSDAAFRQFCPDLTDYEDNGLCLSASPLVAAVYGKFIYGVECQGLVVRECDLTQWLAMSDEDIEGLKANRLDGVLVRKNPDSETCTFQADMLVLWAIAKSRIGILVEHDIDVDPDFVPQTLANDPASTISWIPETLSCVTLLPSTASLPTSNYLRLVDLIDRQRHPTGKAGKCLPQSCEILSGAIGRQLFAYVQERGLPFAYQPQFTVQHALSRLLQHARQIGAEEPVARHLLGATLQLSPKFGIQEQRTGDCSADFLIGDTPIHVTAAPFQAVWDKCQAHLVAGLRPCVIVPARQFEAARELAGDDLLPRISLFSLESFVSQNIDELGVFSAPARANDLARLIATYNQRVAAVERDNSLLIEPPRNLPSPA